MKIEIALLAILFLPLFAAVFCLFTLSRRQLSALHITISLLMLILLVFVSLDFDSHTCVYMLHDWLRADALSVFMLLVICLINFLSCSYSDYCLGATETQEPVLSSRVNALTFYWLLLDIFVFTMLAVVLSNSLGLLWIALESSTLASAFLVGYHNHKTSIEAAWKYIILCTVGITFALNGIVILYYAAIRAGAAKSDALFLSTMSDIAPQMEPGLLSIAFVFILIGFGTKAGLAPMHNWLPDAHSESPAAISALLSAVLLKCALYTIVRLMPICSSDLQIGDDYLLFFGVFSVLIAAIFLVSQAGLKRFLAYSSLEHIGIISIGFGIGSPLAVFGAIFHILTHALTKTMLFFTAGNILLSHGTVEIRRLRGLFATHPLMAIVLFGGGLSLVGMPPFAVFISKFYIIWAALQAGYYKTTVLLLLLLAFVFFTVVFRFTIMVFSDYDDSSQMPEMALNSFSYPKPVLWSILLPFFLLIILCFTIPWPLKHLIDSAVLAITGGGL